MKNYNGCSVSAMPKDKDVPPPVKKKKTDMKGLDWEGDIDFQVYGQVRG